MDEKQLIAAIAAKTHDQKIVIRRVDGYNVARAIDSVWAAQAMMRANKTATTYNEYVLQNSFVWAGNVPNDIRTELDVILEGGLTMNYNELAQEIHENAVKLKA